MYYQRQPYLQSVDVSLLCEFCCVFATLNQIYKTNMTLSLFKGFVWFIIKWGILQICQRQITLVWFTKQLCLYLGTEQRKYESQRGNWPMEKNLFTAFMETLPFKIKSNLFQKKIEDRIVLILSFHLHFPPFPHLFFFNNICLGKGSEEKNPYFLWSFANRALHDSLVCIEFWHKLSSSILVMNFP